MSDRKTICKNYCGISCVDGTCPKANREDYEKLGMDVIKKCDDCHYYRGCDDCAFWETDICPDHEKSDNLCGGGNHV